jgi:sulfite reductase (NADPH) hemoprotein beta-component
LFIENGRVEDKCENEEESGKGKGKGKLIKTGLREIARVHKGTFRLTPNQHLMICNS